MITNLESSDIEELRKALDDAAVSVENAIECLENAKKELLGCLSNLLAENLPLKDSDC